TNGDRNDDCRQPRICFLHVRHRKCCRPEHGDNCHASHLRLHNGGVSSSSAAVFHRSQPISRQTPVGTSFLFGTRQESGSGDSAPCQSRPFAAAHHTSPHRRICADGDCSSVDEWNGGHTCPVRERTSGAVYDVRAGCCQRN